MGTYLYLVYLATLLSASGFNTYNYICNKREQLKIKNRTLVFKKNLSFNSKKTEALGDAIPSMFYLGSTILSLIPLVNLMVPEITEKIYFALDIDSAIGAYFNVLNENELKTRFKNGLSVRLLEECGYKYPDSLKKFEIDQSKIKVREELKEAFTEQIEGYNNYLLSESSSKIKYDEIILLSDKEMKKRFRKSLVLTKDEDIDTKKVLKIIDWN